MDVFSDYKAQHISCISEGVSWKIYINRFLCHREATAGKETREVITENGSGRKGTNLKNGGFRGWNKRARE